MQINYLSFPRYCAAEYQGFLYLLHEGKETLGISRISLDTLHAYYQDSAIYDNHDLEDIMVSNGHLIGSLPQEFQQNWIANRFQIAVCNHGIYIFPLSHYDRHLCGILSFEGVFSKVDLPYDSGFSRCGVSETGECVHFVRMWEECQRADMPFVSTCYIPKAKILTFKDGAILKEEEILIHNENKLCGYPRESDYWGTHNTYYFQNGKLKNKNISLMNHHLWHNDEFQELFNPHDYLSHLLTFANTLVDDPQNGVCAYLNQFFAPQSAVFAIRDRQSHYLYSDFSPEHSASCSLRFKVLPENCPYHNKGLVLAFGLVWDNQGKIRICDCAADDIENLNDDWYIFHWKDENISALRYRPFLPELENSLYQHLLKDSDDFATSEDTQERLEYTKTMLKQFLEG